LHYGRCKIGARERGMTEASASEILSSEIPAGLVGVVQSDARQIVGLVAGGRIELGRCQVRVIVEVGASHDGASEIRIRECAAGGREARIREILTCEIPAGQVFVA